MTPPIAPPERRHFRSLPVQVKYAVLLTLMSGFLFLVMIFTMGFFIQRNYNLFMGDELGVSSQVVEIVRREQRLLESTLFILFCVSVTGMFAATFYVTRKLTGPLVAIQRQLWFYTHGDWTRDFKLRKNDEFKEIEVLVNQLRNQFLAGQNQKRSSH
jgi:hypothetical protein